MIQDGQRLNYINGEWQRSSTTNFLNVTNPTTAETLVNVSLSGRAE